MTVAAPKFERIAVLRALGGLGDVLCVVPALRRLRRAWPEAEITYVGLPQIDAVVARYGDLVDRFLAFPGFPGVPEHPFDPLHLRDFLAERAAAAPFDLAVQMHGSGGVTNVFAALLGARATAGWHVPGTWCPDRQRFWHFPDSLSEVERWTTLAERLGAGGDGDDRPHFPVSDAERATLSAIDPVLAGRDLAILHPGASDPARRWSPASFAAVGDRLAAEGARVVLTGTANEAGIVAQVAAAMSAPATDLCGRTGLGEMAALVERARVVVTNDTGTSHLCAALRTPSVTIFLVSDRARWAAADTRRHVAVGAGVPDVPVGEPRSTAVPPPPGVEEVLRAVDSLLVRA